MAEAAERVTVEIDGRPLSLSNLAKVLYPSGFTKGQVIDYYVRIAPFILPYLAGRNATLRRFPNGSMSDSFYAKNVPNGMPDWVERVRVNDVTYPVISSLATLALSANLAGLELHVPPHRAADDSWVPDRLVFDLDPGPGTGIRECAEIARMVRDLLSSLRLECVVKTSGSKGIQVYAQVVPGMGFEGPNGATLFTKSVAEGLERQHPDLIVSKQTKELRVNRVLIDWSQCTAAKTTVCVYSLRAREEPTVSTPVSWSEIDEAARGQADLKFVAPEVLDRVASMGDLFAFATPSGSAVSSAS